MEKRKQICKDWRELNTPFGKLYIEPWEWHLNNVYPYAYTDQISIYDSRGDWFCSYGVDYFEEGIDEDSTPEKEYEDFCHMIEMGAEEETLQEFLDWLCIDFYYAGLDKEQAAYELSDGHPEELLPEELEINEHVNHIGDNYIVVSEC